MDKLNNLLSTSERIRLMFFREFGDKAQDAMDFVANKKGAFASFKTKETITVLPDNAEDGVYFCLNDGTAVKYDGQETMDNVAHIGLVLGHIKFGVTLRDKGIFKLYRDYERCPSSADYYTDQNGKSCHEEYDFIAATERLKRIGTNIPLADGEYMPLVRQFDVMGIFKTALQKALRAAGGEPLENNAWYWTISEYSRYYAWLVYFSDGNTNASSKYVSGRVRAVVAF